MPSIFLPFQKTLLDCFTVVGSSCDSWEGILYLLFPRCSDGEGVLSSKGVALRSSMAMCGLVPSNLHLMRIFLMVCICFSMNPWPFGWYKLLVANLNQYCIAKFWYSCAMNCFPLSQMIYSTLPYSEMIDSRAEITFVL